MTRTHAAKKLLEHGPLTRKEFIAITGWSVSHGAQILAELCDRKEVKRVRFGIYQLTGMEHENTTQTR